MSRSTTNLLTLALIVCASARATEPDNWDALSGLRAGQRIRVIRTNLKSVDGDFVRMSGDGVWVRNGAEEHTVPKPEVLRVTTAQGARGRRAIIGAAVGAAAGLALTLVAAQTGGNSDGLEYAVAAGGAVTGGLIGAGVGALIPAGTTVYRSPQR